MGRAVDGSLHPGKACVRQDAEAKRIHGLLRVGLTPVAKPFGGVAFDPERRGPDDEAGFALGVGASNNGTRATDGEITTALFYSLDGTNRSVLEDIASEVSLTEEPEITLADMLTDVMHYCHRRHINFSEVLVDAYGHFAAESGGELL